MDQTLKTLFNDGNNNGDITIICENDIKIKCHSFVLEHETEYWKRFKDFTSRQMVEVKREFKLDYDSEIIIAAINRLYNSNYKFDLACYQIIEVLSLIDMLQVKIFSQISKELAIIFCRNLTIDIWEKYVNVIIVSDAHKELYPMFINYYKDTILPKMNSYSIENIEEERNMLSKKLGCKAPSQYQQFVSAEMKKLREQQPGRKNNEYMTMAANAWKEYKKNHPESTTEYVNHPESSTENPEYLKIAADAWREHKEKHNI